MSELEIFAKRLKELRTNRGETQKDFASFLEIKQQTLSGYENGKIKPPIDIAKNIAEKCNVSIDWLCGLSDEISNKEKVMTYSDIIIICNTYKNPSSKIEKTIDEIRKNLYEYLKESEHMSKLTRQGIIDNELYDLWLEKTMEKYDKPIVKEIPEVVDPFKDIEFENFDED